MNSRVCKYYFGFLMDKDYIKLHSNYTEQFPTHKSHIKSKNKGTLHTFSRFYLLLLNKLRKQEKW